MIGHIGDCNMEIIGKLVLHAQIPLLRMRLLVRIEGPVIRGALAVQIGSVDNRRLLEILRQTVL